MELSDHAEMMWTAERRYPATTEFVIMGSSARAKLPLNAAPTANNQRDFLNSSIDGVDIGSTPAFSASANAVQCAKITDETTANKGAPCTRGTLVTEMPFWL